MFKLLVKKLNNRKGFTLVELIVVIAILGILSAIAVPKYNASRSSAEKTAHNANVRTLESAANMYIAENGATAMDTSATKTALTSYVQTWPKTPYAYDGVAKGVEYTVTIAADGTIDVEPDSAP